jgi:ketopantoate hydroxymethyltransferase
VKQYADLRGEVEKAVQRYIEEVQAGVFPDDPHSFH